LRELILFVILLTQVTLEIQHYRWNKYMRFTVAIPSSIADGGTGAMYIERSKRIYVPMSRANPKIRYNNKLVYLWQTIRTGEAYGGL